MMVREPIAAGSFYPGAEARCRGDVQALAERAGRYPTLGPQVFGGIVPHAGWTYSGAVAAKVFQTLAVRHQPGCIVLFGAVHRPGGPRAALFTSGRWQTPLGDVPVDNRLAEHVLAGTNLIAPDPFAHELEHSIEVQVPFIQHLFPQAQILPIMVPASPTAVGVGEAVARTIATYDVDATVVGSSDLTHYGPRYHFTPHGLGDEGLRWAEEVNDRRVIDLMLALEAEGIVPETGDHRNACGGGAVAATVAAVRRLGARRGVLLEHTTSRNVVGDRSAQDAVGYAGVVFDDVSADSSAERSVS